MQWKTDGLDAHELLDAALAMRSRAYAPYSNFAVGAALRLYDGSIVSGCNVENASYGLSVCAERVTLQRAVAAGRLAALLAAGGSAVQLVSAAAVVGDLPQPLTPCGACRQVLAEFAGPDCTVICANLAGIVQHYTLAKLLPAGFTLR